MGCRVDPVKIVNDCLSPVNTKLCEYHLSGIVGCRNGVSVTKYPYMQDGTLTPSLDVYSDGLDATDWVEGICDTGARYDYEKLVLCEVGTGAKVLVESWTDNSDPLQTRTTRYTYLATNLPFTGNVTTGLIDCGGEKLDIQTKQYCDSGETVFGTLVFDASLSTGTPALLGIVFNKIDGSVHTPVNPTEGSCSVASVGVIDGYNGLGNGTYTSISPVSEVQITYDTFKTGYIPNVGDITATIAGTMIGTKVVKVLPNTTRSVKLATNDIASVTINGAINTTVEVVFTR